jgi:aspartyl-tRNA(Asn)/glutamyl-tRNA(Gln) amidotransferase subunit A
MNDILSMPGRVLAQSIRDRALSPVDVVAAFLERNARAAQCLNAFSELYADDAIRAAGDAARDIIHDRPIGPLHGVPIALKDSIDVAGRPTTAGSAHFSDRMAQRSATVVERLLNDGAVIVGKTRMVEFGLGALGLNAHFGTPWNPWNLRAHHAPGGSSSGAAVAVAARLVPWAIGTDTGGSARIPAAWCGVTGMKLTRDRFDMSGIAPLSPTLDSLGPICQDASDLAYLIQALTGIGVPPSSTSTPLQDVRVGVLSDAELVDTEPGVLDAYAKAVDVLAASGAIVVQAALPRSLQSYRKDTSAITFREAYELYGSLARNPQACLGEDVRQRLIQAEGFLDCDVSSVLAERRRMQAEYAAAMADVDALVTPTTQCAAPLVADAASIDPPNRFTRFVNYLDLCAVSVPNGFTPIGLPTGLQIVCGRFCDALAVQIAMAYQSRTDWHTGVSLL